MHVRACVCVCVHVRTCACVHACIKEGSNVAVLSEIIFYLVFTQVPW